MGKNQKSKEEIIVPNEIENEVNQIVDADTISEKIEQKLKKTKLKSGLTREELFQKRVELFGKKKAMLGAFIYKVASALKTEQPAFMERIAGKRKGADKKSAKQGMYLFDSFLKFSAANENIVAGKFFKMDESSDAYKRILKIAEKARIEYMEGKLGNNCKSLIWLCATIYKQLESNHGRRPSGKSAKSKQESRFIREIKEFSFLD